VTPGFRGEKLNSRFDSGCLETREISVVVETERIAVNLRFSDPIDLHVAQASLQKRDEIFVPRTNSLRLRVVGIARRRVPVEELAKRANRDRGGRWRSNEAKKICRQRRRVPAWIMN
jgi:hypothetical protein